MMDCEGEPLSLMRCLTFQILSFDFITSPSPPPDICQPNFWPHHRQDRVSYNIYVSLLLASIGSLIQFFSNALFIYFFFISTVGQMCIIKLLLNLPTKYGGCQILFAKHRKDHKFSNKTNPTDTENIELQRIVARQTVLLFAG